MSAKQMIRLLARNTMKDSEKGQFFMDDEEELIMSIRDEAEHNIRPIRYFDDGQPRHQGSYKG
jgi:hypothetical protein